jgi:hypothetical protein
VTDGIYCNVNFGKEDFIAGAAGEIAVDGGCEVVLMGENCAQQAR